MRNKQSIIGGLGLFVFLAIIASMAYYSEPGKSSERRAYLREIKEIVMNYNNSPYLLFEENCLALTEWKYPHTTALADSSPTKWRYITPKNGKFKGLVFKQKIQEHFQGNIIIFTLEPDKVVKDGEIVDRPIRRKK